MYRFMSAINEKHQKEFSTYSELHQWSIDHIPEFWEAMWDFANIIASRKADRVVDDLEKMPGARWFPGARINFAENLLRYRDDQTALIFNGESQVRKTMTYAQLYDEVARIADSLRNAGIEPGDRIVGFMPNMPETVVAMLAASSLGATWSSCSPDFGIKGVLDRFGQIKPKVLFTADGYFFKGKRIDCLERIADILKDLPSIEKIVVVPYTESEPDIHALTNAVIYSDFRSHDSGLSVQFEQLPFDHPLYIMYSSGTTGLPKCMVQSGGGDSHPSHKRTHVAHGSEA